MHTQRFNAFGVAMTWKIPAISLLAAVSFTNARAQTELQNQWLSEQMLAAKLDRATPRGVSGVAIDATTVKPESAARAGAGAGARTVQSKDRPQSATNAASNSLFTEK